MSIPVDFLVSVPTFELTIPSSEQKITMRPFLVAEQKILLIAMESDEKKDRVRAIKQVIDNCVINPKIDVNSLTFFDLEYIFLQLRAHSKGEVVEVNFYPVEATDCKTCSKVRTVEVNLFDVKVQKHPEHNKIIMLDDNVGVEMSYAAIEDFDEMIALRDNNAEFDAKLLFLAKCIKKIFTKDKEITQKDYKLEEFKEWLDGLPDLHLERILNFFYTLPTLKHTINIDCPECKLHQEYEMRGLDDFLE